VRQKTKLGKVSYHAGLRGPGFVNEQKGLGDLEAFEPFARPEAASTLQNFIPSLLMRRPNKLECLDLAITFQSSLTFAGTQGACPRRKHLKGPPIGLALALPTNSKT